MIFMDVLNMMGSAGCVFILLLFSTVFVWVHSSVSSTFLIWLVWCWRVCILASTRTASIGIEHALDDSDSVSGLIVCFLPVIRV